MKHMKEELKIGIFVTAFFLVVIGGSVLFITSDIVTSWYPSYPIDYKVVTTIDRTIIPVPVPEGSPALYPYQVSNYSKYQYGVWKFDKGSGYDIRLDLMPAGYSNASVTHTARLLNFFAMTDVHITDKETPAQGIYAGYMGGNPSGYSAVLLSTTQVLDAAVQTANALHIQKPFDFGIFLGDAINSDQHNEHRWYIDTLDGKKIIPDSGTRDDPIPGPHNDYQDEYKTAGLNKSINWYQVLGNHDQYWMGTNVPNACVKKTLLGEEILNLGDQYYDPHVLDTRGFYMGSIDGRTPYGDIIGAGPVADFPEPPQVNGSDSERRALSRSMWMDEFFSTTSNPKGHGFNNSDVDAGFACYSFEPRSDVPIKVIVLDDTQRDTDPNVGPYMYASLDTARYTWLVKELDKGQAEGQLMIIAAHMPIRNEPANTSRLWSPGSPVPEQKLVDTLRTYPNLLMWISGHVHRNTVTAFSSPDPAHPELGFWEVETASLRDFP